MNRDGGIVTLALAFLVGMTWPRPVFDDDGAAAPAGEWRALDEDEAQATLDHNRESGGVVGVESPVDAGPTLAGGAAARTHPAVR